MTPMDIARVCHEASRAYDATRGVYKIKPWEDASDAWRRTAENLVRQILLTPDANGRKKHQEWCCRMIEDGWRPGPVTDHREKVHASLVAYESLPFDRRAEDALFESIVNGLRPLVGI